MAKVSGIISVNKITGNISYQQPSGVVAVNPIIDRGIMTGTVIGAAVTAGTLTGTGALSGSITGAAIATGNLISKSIPFLLTSTGDGSGVSTLTMTASEDTILTLDGTAKFYSNAGGTDDESSTWTVTTGGARTRYIKCPSGTANFYVEKDKITSWGAWTSGANAASLSGDISQLTALVVLYIWGDNTISGNISLLTALTAIAVTGTNTISGSIAGLTSLTYLNIQGSNTISGDISGLTSLTSIYCTGSNTLSGSIAGLTSLTYVNLGGSNTISGDLNIVSSGLTACTLTTCQIVTYTAGGDWSAIIDQGYIQVDPAVGYGLSSAEVDLFIIEVEATRAAGRHLHLQLTGSNAARTAASDVAVAAIIADGGTVTTNP